jgi:hypothetical protein
MYTETQCLQLRRLGASHAHDSSPATLPRLRRVDQLACKQTIPRLVGTPTRPVARGRWRLLQLAEFGAGLALLPALWSQARDPLARSKRADVHQSWLGHDVLQSIGPAHSGAHEPDAFMTARASHVPAGSAHRKQQPLDASTGHRFLVPAFSEEQSSSRSNGGEVDS